MDRMYPRLGLAELYAEHWHRQHPAERCGPDGQLAVRDRYGRYQLTIIAGTR